MPELYDSIAHVSTIFSHGPCAAESHTVRCMPQRSKAAIQLKRLRERTGMSVREVAEALERPASSYASYEDKYKKPHLPLDLARALVPIFAPKGIERGEVLALAGITDAFAPEPGRRDTAGLAETPTAFGEMANIDELEVDASAGPGTTVTDVPAIRLWTFPRNVVSIATDSPLERIKIVRVKGDSMSPNYNPLDRLMVDMDDTTPSPAGVFVVWDGLGLVVKRIQFVPHSDPPTVRITSDNPKYESYDRALGEAYIQGRVIGKWLWT